MHEFLLFGRIPSHEHERVLQQLAGVTRMQPLDCKEVHLIFKARLPPSLSTGPPIGGSQDVVQPEVQRTRHLLSGNLFFVQLVGEIADDRDSRNQPQRIADRDTAMTGVDHNPSASRSKIQWRLEFRDTPDAGKQQVTVRLMSRTLFQNGDVLQFLSNFGFEFVSQYLVMGSKFYDQDTTLFVHKVLMLPETRPEQISFDSYNYPPTDDLSSLDSSDSWIISASIEVIDGNNPELKDRATRQLLTMKEILKESVNLVPGDRLALDTRVPATSMR